MARLKAEAVKCKIALSSEEKVNVVIPLIAEKDGKPLALEEEMTRSLFEELIGELVARTHDPIDVVLNDAHISEKELDMVLLVGGSTRVPLIKQDIADYLGLKSGAMIPAPAAAGRNIRNAVGSKRVFLDNGLDQHLIS